MSLYEYWYLNNYLGSADAVRRAMMTPSLLLSITCCMWIAEERNNPALQNWRELALDRMRVLLDSVWGIESKFSWRSTYIRYPKSSSPLTERSGQGSALELRRYNTHCARWRYWSHPRRQCDLFFVFCTLSFITASSTSIVRMWGEYVFIFSCVLTPFIR